MKKPTKAQLLFALDWPWKAWVIGVPVVVLIATATICIPALPTYHDWHILQPLFVLVGLPFLSHWVAGLVGYFVMYPILAIRGDMNGGPFKPGDTVQVLTGSHRGTITTVYSAWQGNSVRVRLGQKEEEETFKDVMCPWQLLREDDPPQHPDQRSYP